MAEPAGGCLEFLGFLMVVGLALVLLVALV